MSRLRAVRRAATKPWRRIHAAGQAGRRICVVLDRTGIRRTLTLLTALSAVLAAVLGWSVVASANDRAERAIHQPIDTSAGRAVIGASIGLARPEPREVLDAILRRADDEMDRAKHRSRGAAGDAPATH